MIYSIAWKNVWRNKLRSLIIISSIVLGLFGGVFSLAFVNGMAQQSINNSIKTEISNIQIHNSEYTLNEEFIHSIPNSDSIINILAKFKEIKCISRRIKVTGMASSANDGVGIMINGIDPINEIKTTDLHAKLIDGNYFTGKSKNQIVIGKELAKKLKLKLRSKIILTMQNSNNEITYGAFRICGIYKTDNTNFDKVSVFVRDKDIAQLIDFSSSATSEIAILLNNFDDTERIKSIVETELSSHIKDKKLVVRTWTELQPLLKMMNDLTVQYSMIFIIIILFALSFGIINTMLMVILERVRELGMLMAIGMNRIRVFYMIMLETVFLSACGGAVGMLISIGFISYYGNTGIDISFLAEGFNAVGYSTIIFPQIDTTLYFTISILIIITAILSSVYPARRALKLNPAEAVRQDV